MQKCSMFTRRLMYHRGEVDDYFGTYVTDYAMALLGAINFVVLLQLSRNYAKMDLDIWVNAHIDTKHPIKRPSRYAPWNWTDLPVTHANITTYTVLFLQLSVTLKAIAAGLTHQFLQEVTPHNQWTDGITWLVMWKIASLHVTFIIFLKMALSEQSLVCDGHFPIPRNARITYYAVCGIGCICIVAFFIHHGFDQKNPYDVKKLFIGYGLANFVFFLSSLVTFLKRCFCNDDEDRTRLHLYLLSSTIMVIALITSILLSDRCSVSITQYSKCPLPHYFNHNAVMHCLFCLAYTILAIAEILSMKTRTNYLNKIDNNNDPI